MKKVLFAALIFTCLPLLASEKCSIEANASIFKTNGSIYKNVDISDQRFVTRTSSWEKCYEFAIKKAKELDESILLRVSGRAILGGSATTRAFISFSWSFNDSLVFDTSGKVTKYTDRFESNPLDIDVRYFADGTLFE